MPGRKKKSTTTDIPMEIPLEGPPIPLEGAPIPREDEEMREIPREDAEARAPEAEAAMEDEVPTRAPTRGEAPANPNVNPPPQAMNKTQSEINMGDNLITSFVNGAKSREIEVVFAFDTTGSMSKYLDEVRKKLSETCTKLTADIPNIRIGIMAFGDYCDYQNYVVKYEDLCNDTSKLVNWVTTVNSTGGGDEPEAYELALREAKGLSWSPKDTVNKAFVIIGDAPPHPPSYTTENIYWRDEVAALVKKGVKIYGVHCGMSGSDNLPFYEEVAEMSGGICLSLKHLQLITDMFKAVCYREFGAEHLETYRAEVQEGGRMDDKMEDLFTQLKQGPNAKTKLGERSKANWYLSQYDKTTTPSFSLSETAGWERYTGKGKAASVKKATATTTTTTSSPKSLKRKDDEPEASSSSTSPAKKVKTAKPKKEKEVKEKAPKKKSTSPKKKATGAKKAKKVEKVEKDESEGESEGDDEKPKKLEKATSVIVGTGDWKRDRFGRMASLHDS